MTDDIVTRIEVDTSEALAATLKYSQSLVKLQVQQDRTAAAQTKLDAALAASGAGSNEAVAAQARLEAALRKTSVAEDQVAIAAARSSEVQAAAANKAAAAQEAAAAKQAAAYRKVGTVAGGIGAAVAVGLGLAAKATADFDAKLATFRSLSGASAKQMQQLSDSAHGFANLGIGASDAADAMIELTKAGLSVQQILGGGLRASLLLAADGQMAVADATAIMASAMVQFKLPASEAGHVADDLAAGADKALGSVQDLGEGLQYAGLGAHQAGMSIDETVGALAEFAQAGLVGSQGGTTLQQVLRQLLGPTQTAAAEIKTLGLNLYDAKGHFVGLASVAGQLQSKLGAMSEADRNAALNTLFTSRAVRGATILYQDGKAGVDKWVKSVNDSGFAAQQASGKMDSFQGDLQKLGAVVQNDLIDVGQQLQPILRDITQDLTTLGNALGGIPDPVKAVGVQFGVAVAALGLGFWAFTRLKGAAASLAETLGVLSAAQVETGTTATTMAAEEDVAATSMTRAGAASKTGMLGGVNKGAAGRLGGGLGLLLGGSILQQQGGALGSVGSPALNAAGLGLMLGGTTAAIPLGAFAAIFAGAKYAHDHPGPKQYAPPNTFEQPRYGGSFQSGGVVQGVSRGMTQLEQHPFQVSGAQSAKVLQQLDISGQQASAGLHQAASGADVASASFAQLQSAADKAWKTMLTGEQSVLAKRNDFRSYQAAIDDANAALKQNGKTLNANTAAGRANAASLDQIASSASQYAQTISDPVLQLKFLQHSRDELFQTARSFGMSQSAAHDYVNQVLGIPKEARTEAAFEKNQAMNDVATYEHAIDKVPGFKNTVITAQTEQAEQALGRVRGDLVAIQSKSVWVTVGTRYVHSGVQAGGYADGGQVRGPGTAMSDSILARLSNREYVHPVRSVDHYGVAFMESIRQRTFPKPRGFADGGTPYRSPMPAQRWMGAGQTVVMSDPAMLKRLESIEARLGKLSVHVSNGAEIGGASQQTAWSAARNRATFQDRMAQAAAAE